MTLDAMFFGAFFGLISAVAIYHLLMYAILRVPEFLSYGIYLATLTFFVLGRERARSTWRSEPWPGFDRADK